MVDTIWCASENRTRVAQAFLDRNGTIIEINHKWSELFGFKTGELLYTNINEMLGDRLFTSVFFESDLFEPKLPNKDSVQQKSSQVNGDFFADLKQFKKLKVQTNGISGIDTTLTCILTPIQMNEREYLLQVMQSHSEDADTAFQPNEAFARKILNGIKDGIITIKLDGTFLFVNDKAERLLGMSGEQFNGRDFWSLLQMDQPGLSKKVYELLSGEESIQVEYYIDEMKAWYDVRAYRIEDQVTLYFTDCSKRKEMEHDLRESERRYKSLVEHTPETISVHDGSKLIYINPAGEKLFKAANRKELINKKIEALYKADDFKRIRENARLLLSGKKKMTTSVFELQCLDGSKVDVEATSTVILFKGKPAFRTILKDVSERNRMDDLIRKSDKLSVVAQLAAGVAHEIRNPLTAIKGFLQLFQREKEFNEQFLDLVMEELERVESIIYEYLTLAKPNHESTFDNLHLQPLVNKVMTLVETQSIMKNVQIDFEYENVPPICGSEKQLKQVLLNLIKNAIEAVDVNGEIVIRLLNHAEDQICIQIEDNGCGISSERIARLGEPFYSTKEKGTGLGLMVCYKIIEHHQGILTIHSEEGAGTRIDVILPVYEG
ncbi:PAS/PAC signal transduction histidine kinase SpoIIJ-like protein [Alkalihalophilus pseudofirmus OF4]|uniref:histidine kinase n=1 Tax=Alkalihalophilus pseudofirmus (strain ATCC BAA-2126 / JCM 17055 / OF4) TaxID=398511 RepID=D3FYP4_ALKPO|nr:PAS domain-containing sensor histidine kinase [Alkalihalophilus pseudofirmus]ADC50896.1 PAS/PAC signal transduction histidine kinase SpoIIJ-like protein [Alkalihalophilus pseudofirmus OF4]